MQKSQSLKQTESLNKTVNDTTSTSREKMQLKSNKIEWPQQQQKNVFLKCKE